MDFYKNSKSKNIELLLYKKSYFSFNFDRKSTYYQSNSVPVLSEAQLKNDRKMRNVSVSGIQLIFKYCTIISVEITNFSSAYVSSWIVRDCECPTPRIRVAYPKEAVLKYRLGIYMKNRDCKKWFKTAEIPSFAKIDVKLHISIWIWIFTCKSAFQRYQCGFDTQQTIVLVR